MSSNNNNNNKPSFNEAAAAAFGMNRYEDVTEAQPEMR